MAAQNRLLEELPSGAFNSVRAACGLVELAVGDVLLEPGERIRDVYFPTESIVSLVAKVTTGATLEVALVGDEGMVGLPLLLGANTKSLQVLVQKSGEAWCMRAAIFKRMADTNRPWRRALNNYACLRLAQSTQNAVCVSAHPLEARLGRRLLMMQDRSHSDVFHATQKSLASMLGVRRSTVTFLSITLQQKKTY
jgi:CRP-like cAMP-binding protein